MVKLNLRCMKEISGERKRRGGLGHNLARRAVERVAHHRMTNRCEMHPDLMCAAGFDRNLQQRKLSKWRFDPALHVIMRDCLAAPTSTGGHANPADGIAADRTRNGAAIF